MGSRLMLTISKYVPAVYSIFRGIDGFRVKEMPSDGGKPLSEVWDGTEVGCAAYVIERLDAAEGNIMNVSIF